MQIRDKGRRLTSSEKRRKACPDIGEQLDVIWKQLNHMRISGDIDLIQEAEDMLGKVLEVKSKIRNDNL